MNSKTITKAKFDSIFRDVRVAPHAGAIFSEDRRHRFSLWRRIREPFEKNYVNWIMLNPSTADEKRLDPTCTRCFYYSDIWGFNGIVVTNLFAIRATDPRAMLSDPGPVGDHNDQFILDAADRAGLIIVAWGQLGKHRGRESQVLTLLSGYRLYCLGINQDGSPKHPLYLCRGITPKPFNF